MSVFSSIPLGQRIPGSPHSVACSLPTLHDIVGYEEGRPETTRHIASGYPRFVVHSHARQLCEYLARRPALAGRSLWLVTSATMAKALANHLGLGTPASAIPFNVEGINGVAHTDTPELNARGKIFLQHLGGFLSSRAAEDHLVRLGVRDVVAAEKLFVGDATAEIKRVLRGVYAGAGDTDILLAPSGMNALFAAFRAISAVQAPRGRTAWVQLGWLYLDSIALLKKFTPDPARDYLRHGDVTDLAGLERLFAEHGSRIAGLVIEAPTNPLIQTPDVAAVAALARRHGAMLILDPAISSPFNVDLLPHADLVAQSLTKYTAHEGDVITGAVVVNSTRPAAAELRRLVAENLEPVHPRDLARLAAQIGAAAAMVARMNASTIKVADFLENHPAVQQVWWALQPSTRANYLQVARTPQSVGGMISFTLKGPLAEFYDRVRLPKGPSFGMQTTLLSPFLYLAHYDLVTSAAGRAELAAHGLSPELLRLSVGIEPVDDIIATLAEALEHK
ncbi:MAG: Cys/Met metabolism pyridoxal-phosphate-dependent protein [Lacunisphaera sp.]|nr:Cys/Met metabolism pyridoxal-phosphate-dependent protein [Lacunisphaera sp.]